jgi:hypothetical protein
VAFTFLDLGKRKWHAGARVGVMRILPLALCVRHGPRFQKNPVF